MLPWLIEITIDPGLGLIYTVVDDATPCFDK